MNNLALLSKLNDLVDARNSDLSIYDEIINDYNRLLDLANLANLSSPTSSYERDRLRLIDLQQEVIILHQRINAASEQTQRLAEANAELNQKLSDWEIREVSWKKEKSSLLAAIKEKEGVIQEKDRVIQLQADEYTTLRLDANIVKKKYAEIRRDYDELLDRYTSGQTEIAEKLNLEIEEYERKLKEHSSNVVVVAADANSDASSGLRSTFLGAVSGFFGQVYKPEPATPLRRRPSPHPIVMPTVCPRKKDFEWTASSVDCTIAKFHPCGRVVAIGGGDRKINIFELEADSTRSPKLQFTYVGSNGAISALDWDKQGSILYSGSTDYSMRLWGYGPTKRLLQTHTGHTGRISAVCYCSENQIATGSQDRTIKLWDLVAHQCSRTLCIGSSCLDMKLYCGDGPILVSTHHDKTLRLHDNRTPNKIVSECGLSDRCPCIGLIGDCSTQVVCCLRNNRVCSVDARMMQIVFSVESDQLRLYSDCQKCDLSADLVYLAVGSTDGNTLVFDVKSGVLEQTLETGRNFPVVCACWQPCQMDGATSSGSLLVLETQKTAIVYK